MIGKTNSRHSVSKMYEYANIRLVTNQSEHSDLRGVKFSVRYEAFDKEYVWDGNEVTLEVPAHVAYSVEFGECEGYNTPKAESYIATGGNSRTIEVMYNCEILTLNINSDEGELSGFEITIYTEADGNMEILGVQTSATGVHKIPFGVTYNIEGSNINGYQKPSVISRIANEKTFTINLQYMVVKEIDLSMQDIYGNAIHQTTANCYVVNKVNTYKIPLVFGNALKNGATNSAAYTKNSGSNSHDFVDFNGTVVTSPYIETVSGTAASAQLSIADTDGIFTDISIVDGSPCRYLQFKVASVPDTGANGVISIKNSNGVIMWSWHIWVWSYDLTPVEITNNTGVKYNILPVNLATKLDTADSINKTTGWKNWLYQFGRPNPILCPSAYNSTSKHAGYGTLDFDAASIASNIQTGIKNPATFYKYSSSYNNNWFQTNSDKTYNLWDAACTSTGSSDNNVVKTIYDPCPIGFKIPNGNTLTGLSTSNVVGSFNSGYKFKRYSGDTVGVFFPASGCRNHSTGSLGNVGSSGYVWISSARSQDYVYFLYFYSGSVYPQTHNSRAFGFSVRPVQE